MSEFEAPETWFSERDTIKAIIAVHLKAQTTRHWLDILEPADIWCSDVFSWERLRQEEGYRVLEWEQEVVNGRGTILKTSRCPINIDGRRSTSRKGAPFVGEDNQLIEEEFAL